ncbi:MAG: 4Fe-4S dicluster domain-containing protein [Lachnospiraceae bacterium]|nr:4Fe-4S dicluster domain-containing protein [Lachnospiraceae bacterium]
MATIYCFSATGNSLYAAKEIAKECGGTVLPIKDRMTVCEDDVIGLVFPCYFWALPRVVEYFVSQIKITSENPYVFAVMTCGGRVFGALAVLKRILRKNQIKLNYAKSIISVTNYLPGYLPKDSEKLQKNVDIQINKISKDIKAHKSNRVFTVPLVNQIIYKFYPNENSDRFFAVNSSCNLCGTCIKVCPADNITIIREKPHFKRNCEHCLACLHNCPAAAIDWKNKTQGKERYRNKKVSLNEIIMLNDLGNYQ